ncbi:MAG TPA: 3D domain-containing protein [Pyrinomonadaceae bacterium]|nr:3D domain-containing protein [Pyrinomonadaceae bacterium]
MAKTLFGGSAVLTGALLLSALTFNAPPSVAGNLAGNSNAALLAGNSNQTAQARQTTPEGQGLLGEIPAPTSETSEAPEAAESAGASAGDTGGAILSSAKHTSAPPAQKFTATAYALRGRTASGAGVRRGLIAADRRVLPLGTRVRVEAGGYSGEYLVADTGGLVRGRKIDIWVPSTREAMRFGRRAVKLTILKYGGRRAPKAKPPR